MTSRQRSLKVNIIGDISDLKRDLSAIERRTQSTSQKFSQVGTALKGAFTVAALAQVGKMVGQLNELGIAADNIRNRFNVVFGSEAGDVAAWADQVNERFGVSVETIQQMAAEIGDLLVPLGFTRREAADLTREILETSNALSEWTGGQISAADAAERVRKAMLGERDGLEALGVKILQSDINARLAAEGQSKLTGEEKARAEALATLNIVTEKSSDALFAYANNTNEALITQKALTAAIEDGRQALADIVTNEYDALQDNLAAAGLRLQNFNEWLQEQADSADDAAASNRGMLESLIALNPIARRALEWSEDRNQALFDEAAATDRAAAAMENARRAAGGFNPALAETATQAGKVEKEITDATEAIKGFQSGIRAQIDPLFALRQAEDRLADAQERKIELEKDRKTSADDLVDADAAIVDAQIDLEFAFQNVEDGLGSGIRLLEEYGTRAGLAADEIARLTRDTRELARALQGLPTSPAAARDLNVDDPNRIRILKEELERFGAGERP